MHDRLLKLSAWCVLTSGWTRYLSAFVAGLFSSLAMAPFDAFPILFLTLPIFIWLLDGAYSDARSSFFGVNKTAFLTGWWFGFGYFVAGLWWIANALLVEANTFAWLIPLAVAGLPAGLAIFWGLAAITMRWFWRENWTRIFIFAIFLSLFEYLRGTILTGFPWNTIGYAAMINPLMMQSSAVLGLYGVTFFALIIFASPLVSLTSTTKDLDGKRPKGVLYFALFLSVLHIGYGAYRLSANPTKFNDEASLRIVQPNINQADKFEEENSSKILATYLSLSSKPGIEDTTHVFWPESAFPFFLTERPDALSAIAAMLPDNAQLITGAVRAEAGKSGDPYGFVYNTTYSINSEGAIEAAADKVHLVPFGEYLPFQTVLEAFGLRQITRLRGGFEAGVQTTLIDSGKAGMLLPLICYEIIFPQEAYAFKGNDKQRPSAVVNVTNDAWYGNSPGPYQHSRQSIIRSVEMGLPLIRVANSGISSVSDAFGRVQAKLDLNEKGFFDTKMPLAANRTLFIEYGMLPFFISLLAFFALCLGKNIILKD